MGSSCMLPPPPSPPFLFSQLCHHLSLISPLLASFPPFLHCQLCTSMFAPPPSLPPSHRACDFIFHLLYTPFPLPSFSLSRPLACLHARSLACSLSCHLMGCCCYGNVGGTCLHSSVRKTKACKVSHSLSLFFHCLLSNSNALFA